MIWHITVFHIYNRGSARGEAEMFFLKSKFYLIYHKNLLVFLERAIKYIHKDTLIYCRWEKQFLRKSKNSD